MKLQYLAFVLGVGMFSNLVQAGITLKTADGTSEQVQVALVGLQTKATVLGFAKNQYDLGMAYYEGKLVERDPKKAAEWLSKAAKKNYAPAMFVLGGMLLGGDGVNQNIPLGSQLINSAAAKGDKSALAFIDVAKNDKSITKVNNQINQNQAACSLDIYDYGMYILKDDPDIHIQKVGSCSVTITQVQQGVETLLSFIGEKNKGDKVHVITKTINGELESEINLFEDNEYLYSIISRDIGFYGSTGNHLDPVTEEPYTENTPNVSKCFFERANHRGITVCYKVNAKSENDVYIF